MIDLVILVLVLVIFGGGMVWLLYYSYNEPRVDALHYFVEFTENDTSYFQIIKLLKEYHDKIDELLYGEEEITFPPRYICYATNEPWLQMRKAKDIDNAIRYYKRYLKRLSNYHRKWDCNVTEEITGNGKVLLVTLNFVGYPIKKK